MADRVVKVITPADTYDLLSLDGEPALRRGGTRADSLNLLPLSATPTADITQVSGRYGQVGRGCRAQPRAYCPALKLHRYDRL
jgi:hypothetical protein